MTDDWGGITDATIREVEARSRARAQERREEELIKQVAGYLDGAEPLRLAAAREIIRIVRNASRDDG